MLYGFCDKTGVYGVSVKEESGNEIVVEIEEVIKHGKEGDLEDGNEREGVFFHEGKALSDFEKGQGRACEVGEFNVEGMGYEE